MCLFFRQKVSCAMCLFFRKKKKVFMCLIDHVLIKMSVTNLYIKKTNDRIHYTDYPIESADALKMFIRTNQRCAYPCERWGHHGTIYCVRETNGKVSIKLLFAYFYMDNKIISLGKQWWFRLIRKILSEFISCILFTYSFYSSYRQITGKIDIFFNGKY